MNTFVSLFGGKEFLNMAAVVYAVHYPDGDDRSGGTPFVSVEFGRGESARFFGENMAAILTHMQGGV